MDCSRDGFAKDGGPDTSRGRTSGKHGRPTTRSPRSTTWRKPSTARRTCLSGSLRSSATSSPALPPGGTRATPRCWCGRRALRFHVLHDRIVHARHGAAVEDGDNVGMAQAGSGPRFLREPGLHGRLLRIRVTEHLDRHRALQHAVAGRYTCPIPRLPAWRRAHGVHPACVLVLAGSWPPTVLCVESCGHYGAGMRPARQPGSAA